MPDRYLLKSTNMFLHRMKTVSFEPNDQLISFDAVSLYTNVPLQETIDLISEYVYDQPMDDQPPFKKLIFKRLLKAATGGIFAYQDKLYRQTDGIMMGSPLGPTMANFLLAHHENKLLESMPIGKPKAYMRYVDDIFCVFPDSVDYHPFLEAMNKFHKNIEFTTEIGGTQLAFLDVNISIQNADFETMIYRKPTNTGVILNYSALCPMQWKVGLLTCLLFRAWMICSSYKLFHQEVIILKEMFLKNGYPQSFFERVLKSFLLKKMLPFSGPRSESQDDMEKFYILRIPYIGRASIQFRRKLTKLVKETMDMKLRCVFHSCKVRNFFSLKCKSSHFLQSNVVYKFSCRRDASIFYVGETGRHLGIRASEHLNTTTSSRTAVANHILDCDECMDHLSKGTLNHNSFEILKHGQTKNDIEMLEAMLINELKPCLNIQSNLCTYTLRIYG